jgi:hypothetical protein
MTPIEWALAAAAYSALEYWLGKTDKMKAGSVVEAVLFGVKSAAGVFLKKKDQ